LDCVELSAHVRLTAPYFWTNDGVLNDPRVRLINEDGATYARYTDQTYDVISLEPPELHTAGVVNLYTLEFYENLRRILNPGGLVAHWFTAGQIPEPEWKMLLGTFMTQFPYTVLFTELESTTYVAIGSAEPIVIDLDVLERWLQQPRVANHLKSIKIPDVPTFLSYFVAGQDRLWEYVGHDPQLITDDRTYVDFTIPRSGAAGFGFGLAKHPKSQKPLLERTAAEWELIERLRIAEPLSRWIRSAGDIPADLQSRIDDARARRRAARTKRPG